MYVTLIKVIKLPVAPYHLMILLKLVVVAENASNFSMASNSTRFNQSLLAGEECIRGTECPHVGLACALASNSFCTDLPS